MTDPELVKLLSTDTAENRRLIDEWFRRTPPNMAADILARLLDKHKAGPPGMPMVGVVFLIVFAALMILFLILKTMGVKTGVGMFPGLFFFAPLLAATAQNATIGRRAALLLAELQDQRAIPGLAAAWQPAPHKPADRAENERIETELLRLITQFTGTKSGSYNTSATALRKLLQRAAAHWRRDVRRRSPMDLTDTRADLLLAAIRFCGMNGLSEDMTVLRQIAELPLPLSVSAAPPKTKFVNSVHAAVNTPVNAAETVSTAPVNRESVREAAAYLSIEEDRRAHIAVNAGGNTGTMTGPNTLRSGRNP
jgi:hypothetical protein